MDLQIIPLDDPDRFIIYRPLLPLAFIGNKAMANVCSRFSTDLSLPENWEEDEVLCFLANSGFFLQDRLPTASDLIQSNAVLLLTNQCQLRCTYCYAAAGEFSPRSLSVESGKAVIDYAFGQAEANHRTSFRVDFHGGGEPSLEWRLLQEFTDYSRKKSIPANIALTSNAIWSIQQCDWIIKNINRITISMDGAPATQNRQRPFQNNTPSSSFVMKNLHKLDDAGFSSYGIRMTACYPWSNLSEDVNFILDATACRSIQVEPAFNHQRGAHVQPDQDQYHLFSKAFLDAYDIAHRYGANFQFSGARPGTMTRIFCTAPYNTIVVNPEDSIVACYEVVNSKHPLADVSTFGTVRDGSIHIDQKKRHDFHEMLQERFEKTCKDCYCRWTCAGDCYMRAFSSSDDLLLTSPRCSMNREITKNMILNLISQRNGVWQPVSLKMNYQDFG